MSSLWSIITSNLQDTGAWAAEEENFSISKVEQKDLLFPFIHLLSLSLWWLLYDSMEFQDVEVT